MFLSDRVWLRDRDCTQDSCEAIRQEGTSGLELNWRPIKPLGLFGHVEHVHETNTALEYKAYGYGFGAGVKGGFSVADRVGLHGWAEFDWRHTDSEADSDSGLVEGANYAQRFTIVAGAAAVFGSSDDNLIGWIGADAAFVGLDESTVDVGSYTVETMPYFPATALGGVMIVSEPLGGPWAERGRLACGLSADVGYKTGMGLWLSAAL